MKAYSVEALQTFLKTHKEAAAFSGLHAARDTPLPKRRWIKVLSKVKQAVCEIDVCDGLEVVIDCASWTLCKSSAGKLAEIATVNETAAITFPEQVSGAARDRVAELLWK